MSCFVSSTALPVLLYILLCLPSTNSSPPPKSPSFSAPLIHRNSPESPFYDPSLTHADFSRLAARAARARILARNEVVGLDAYTALVVPRVIPSTGLYYMKYKIGDPPIETYGIPDTASGLVWLQCQPCKRCYKQSIPIFNSTESSSFNKVLCTDIICKSDKEHVRCLSGDTFCSYDISYGDGSMSEGDVVTETITLQDATTGGIVQLTNMVIGCGNYNKDSIESDPDLPPGIIGLKRSNLSLVNQLGFNEFSHCISTTEGHSLLKIGMGANITGPETHTRLIPNPTNGWYFVNILGIIVGDVQLEVPPSVFKMDQEGTSGTHIDTGTQYFELVQAAYGPLVEEIRFQMEVIVELKPIVNQDFELCYGDVRFAPKIVIVFEGLDFEISNANVWDQVDEEEFCLTIMGGSDSLSVFGMNVMRDVNVGYDLANNVLSLANTDCPLIQGNDQMLSN